MGFLPYFLGGCILAILVGGVIIWWVLMRLLYLTAELPVEQREVVCRVAKKIALGYIEHIEKKRGEDLRHFKEMLR